MSKDASLCINDLPAEAIHLAFGFLAPRDLCRTSAVCKSWRDLNKDASANRVWEGHYAKRWKAPAIQKSGAWQMHYSLKMRNAQAFSRKGLADVLYGHTAGVSSICLLPASNLLATGSVDSTVRLWDLAAGLPVGCSRNLKHTVRALSLDDTILACGGGQDGAIRLWRSQTSMGTTGKFDLSLLTRLVGHSGPVVSLESDKRLLYSGSWDCSVRFWNKLTLKREALLAFPDWVNSAKPCGSNLLVTAGQTLYVCDVETGKAVAKHLHSALPGNIHWEAGRPTSPLHVEGSQDGRLVYLAGTDGAVVAIDPREKVLFRNTQFYILNYNVDIPRTASKFPRWSVSLRQQKLCRTSRQQAAVLWDQNSAVKGLSFEDPWLAAATYSGSVLLMDVEAILRGGRGSEILQSGQVAARKMQQSSRRAARQRLSGPRGSVLCVDIADRYLACGSGDPVVRTWGFQHPEKEERPSTARRRAVRNTRRLRNRFAYSSSSDDEAENGGEAATNSVSPRVAAQPLSQSLPAHLEASPGFSRLDSNLECGCTEGGRHNHPSNSMGSSKMPGSKASSCYLESGHALCANNESAPSMIGRQNESALSRSQTDCLPERSCVNGFSTDSGYSRDARTSQRQRGALVPVPLRCRAEVRRMLRGSLESQEWP